MNKPLRLRSIGLFSLLLLLIYATFMAGMDRVLAVFATIIAMFIGLALFMLVIELIALIITPLEQFIFWRKT